MIFHDYFHLFNITSQCCLNFHPTIHTLPCFFNISTVTLFFLDDFILLSSVCWFLQPVVSFLLLLLHTLPGNILPISLSSSISPTNFSYLSLKKTISLCYFFHFSFIIHWQNSLAYFLIQSPSKFCICCSILLSLCIFSLQTFSYFNSYFCLL